MISNLAGFVRDCTDKLGEPVHSGTRRCISMGSRLELIERLGGSNVWIWTAWYLSVYLLDRLAHTECVRAIPVFGTANGLSRVIENVGRRPFATERNCTAPIPVRCHDGCMLHKKARKETGKATRARVEKEMAKPRMTRSARIAELKLETIRPSKQGNAATP
jgi:hypothetical protein